MLLIVLYGPRWVDNSVMLGETPDYQGPAYVRTDIISYPQALNQRAKPT
jgi:hypothetical protein